MQRHATRARTWGALIAALLAAPLLARGEAAPPPAAAGPSQKAPVTKPQAGGGVQWFTHLKDGLAEARRTGKPILYLSAAPSCGGAPGVW